jgi:tellurite methyltransferase
MALESWEEKYRENDAVLRPPDALLVEIADAMTPGRALDLACGTGRNALWLAQQGWRVTAVDGSPSAIATLRSHAAEHSVRIDAQVADLEKGEYRIEPARWDLIAICYYLQRDLYETAKQGLAPGGTLLAIALMVEPGREYSPFRVQAGELRRFFEGWEIQHEREGADAAHGAVVEIAVRRPLTSLTD